MQPRLSTTPYLLVMALLWLAACLPVSAPSSAQDQPADGPGTTNRAADPAQTHLLLTGAGPVKLQRRGWVTAIPVAFGTLLRPGDRLEPEGQTTILCADLTVRTLSGIGGVPCRDARQTVLNYQGAKFVMIVRAGADEANLEDIPYVLYPRTTLILEKQPLIRWHDTGAGSYEVTLLEWGQPIWTATVTGAEIQYPDDAPELMPATDYQIQVTELGAGGNSSSDDPALGTGFELIAPEDLAVVEERRQQILSLASLNEMEQQYALAVYYTGARHADSGFRLLGEARTVLDSLTQTQPTPGVYLRLGEVLAGMYLIAEPQAAFEAALASAEALGDKESQAQAHAALWRLTKDKGHRDAAEALLTELGDTEQAQALLSDSAEE